MCLVISYLLKSCVPVPTVGLGLVKDFVCTCRYCGSVEAGEDGVAEVVGENAVAGVATGAHGGGSDLAEADAVSPTGSVQDESGRDGWNGMGIRGGFSFGVYGVHDKGRTVQV